MKILFFNIKKPKKLKMMAVNLIIVMLLLTVFAFSYAGGSLEVFNTKTELQAIYKGDTTSKNVSLMFNVYWGDEYIDSILNILQNHNAKATFFVGGVWASKNNDFLSKIIMQGHELGNHGYNHKDHDKISSQGNYDEINQTHQIVKSITNVDMNLFAPPSGAFNQTTLLVAESLGYKTIMWSKDTIDWRDKDKSLIIKRATKNASGGDLILMHPTEKTVEALSQIIEYYEINDFILTTVSNTINGSTM